MRRRDKEHAPPHTHRESNRLITAIHQIVLQEEYTPTLTMSPITKKALPVIPFIYRIFNIKINILYIDL
jgi:hypothetical protein